MNEPWKNEPDRKNWTAHGLPCAIFRHSRLLHLCGYVGIDNTHPLFGKSYSETATIDVVLQAHGGITFAGELRDGNDLWWLGFDCSHAWDLAPGSNVKSLCGYQEYRDIDYVTCECESLAKQLADFVGPHETP